MFLDPKRDGECIKAKHSLAALIAWLETRDPHETYNYTRPATCLVGQWQGKEYDSFEIDRETFPGCEEIAFGYPWTFGGALARARELQGRRD